MENKELQIKLTNKLYETRLDPDKLVDQPPILLSVIESIGTTSYYKPIFSLGDLSLIQGRQKSKKTFFTSAICTS